MSQIDPQAIDIDFPSCPEYVFGNAGRRAFGAGAFASYGDVVPEVPESQWPELAEKLESEGGGLDQLVTRIYDQQREGSCHSEDTEVLTEKGWVGWPEYNWSDRLGTMNPATGLLEFQSPIARHVYDYDGEMVYGAHRSIDFAVTDNHRMLVRRWDERQRSLTDAYGFVEAGNLGWYVGLPHATLGFLGTELVKVAIDGDREYAGDDFAAFLGVLVADGWAGGTENTRNRVSFCCFHDERQEMIRRLAARIGFREQPGRRGVWYRQDAPALAEWLRANVYNENATGALDKRVPTLIKSASQRQVAVFLEFFGDKSHTREHGNQYYTSSELLADDLQELALRIGRRASINRRDPRTSHINGRPITDSGGFVVTEWGGSNLSLQRKKHVGTERYRGPVYCATVPNGTLVTRRNKSVLVSGNCVANACCQAMEILQAKQFGKDAVTHLSAISVYRFIGRSPQSGATLDDGLEQISSVGAVPLDTPENRAKFGDIVMPNTGWSTPMPPGWQGVAKRFRGTEWFICQSVNQLISALFNGHPVVVGRAGHSIAYCRPVYQSGRLLAKYANSWSEDWQDGGFGYDSLNYIRQSASWAFALRSVVVPSTTA